MQGTHLQRVPADDGLVRPAPGPFSDIRADRMFCLADHSLFGRPNYFSSGYCDWFRARGGVLVHRPNLRFLEGEHWIGLGVDPNVVRPAADGVRNQVLFDFPMNKRRNTADTSKRAMSFDVSLVSAPLMR